jgi:hypothetical protein
MGVGFWKWVKHGEIHGCIINVICAHGVRVGTKAAQVSEGNLLICSS